MLVLRAAVMLGPRHSDGCKVVCMDPGGGEPVVSAE